MCYLTQWGESLHNIYVYQIMLYSFSILQFCLLTSIKLEEEGGNREPKTVDQFKMSARILPLNVSKYVRRTFFIV